MAIPLNAIGRGYICLNPPWANKLFSLRALANPKGVVPPALARFIPAKGTVPLAALRVVAARGGVSGGNAKTRKRYVKTGAPTRTLRQILA
ncbi:MAG: hypothetical protein ABIH46_02380 [Chloroflexota bacterium]